MCFFIYFFFIFFFHKFLVAKWKIEKSQKMMKAWQSGERLVGIWFHHVNVYQFYLVDGNVIIFSFDLCIVQIPIVKQLAHERELIYGKCRICAFNQIRLVCVVCRSLPRCNHWNTWRNTLWSYQHTNIDRALPLFKCNRFNLKQIIEGTPLESTLAQWLYFVQRISNK